MEKTKLYVTRENWKGKTMKIKQLSPKEDEAEKQLKKKINADDGRKLHGLKRWRKNEKKKAEETKMLQVNVGELTNQNQQLKWKLDQHSSRRASGIKKPVDIVTPKATTASPVALEVSVPSIIWDSLSPTSNSENILAQDWIRLLLG